MATLNGEVQQATGAQTQIAYAKETTWGTAPTATLGLYRLLNVIGGESFDDNITMFSSAVIRNDRMRNKSVRGTRRPGGTIPLELAPVGVSQFLWHLLGDNVTTTSGPVAATNEAQTLTLTGATGGTFTVTFGGITTAAISYNAIASVVQTAFDTAFGAGNTTVSGTGPWTVTFAATYAGENVPLLVVNTASLTGTNISATITQSTPAVMAVPAGCTKHVIKGTTALPTGFTIEKGFLDLATPYYFAYTGCRINSAAFNFNIDQIVQMSLDIMAQSASTPSTTAAAGTGGTAPAAAPVVQPFSNIDVAVMRDGKQLAVARSASMNIRNALYGDAGIILGATTRQSLKPGTRAIDGNGSFLFGDLSLYNAAINGDNVWLTFRCTQGNLLVQFDIPSAQFIPNNSTPKIANDGPIDISLNWEAFKDATEGTDIICTIITTEASIKY